MTSVTGTISSTVVTLSSSAETTAVTSTSRARMPAGLPRATLAARIARYSKMPLFRAIETITIIPASNPMVLKSIPATASSWFRIPVAIIRIAPSRATMARLRRSVMMTP